MSTRADALASGARVVDATTGAAESAGGETGVALGSDGGVMVSCAEAGEDGADGVRAGGFITA